MGKYSIKDFKVGDEVYHLSNTKLHMVAIKINSDSNTIICRWMDSTGNTQTKELMPEELGKTDDLRPTIRVQTL